MNKAIHFAALPLVVTVLACAGAAWASVIGEDGRGPLDRKAAQLSISKDELGRLRAATGYIVCPGTTHDNGIVASAALVVSNRLLLTVGHAFVDEKGRERGPLGECVFRNQAPNPVEIAIDPDQLVLGLTTAEVHSALDFAVVVLSRPVRAEPLPVRVSTVDEGETVIGLAAWQQMPGVDIDANMPVAQACEVRVVEAGGRTRPTNFLTDCDLGQVGSGGQVLTRVNGELAVTAIFSSSASGKADGEVFDVRLGRYTRAIAVDGPLRAALEAQLNALAR